MRVWDIPVVRLCNKHLIAQHAEIHAIYSIIVNNKKGYANHPEVNRWRSNIDTLISIHNFTVIEMYRRKIKHNSPIEHINCLLQPYITPYQSLNEQIKKLKAKGCECKV